MKVTTKNTLYNNYFQVIYINCLDINFVSIYPKAAYSMLQLGLIF